VGFDSFKNQVLTLAYENIPVITIKSPINNTGATTTTSRDSKGAFMIKPLLTIISTTILTTQLVFATCATSNIPGHYTGRYVDNNNGTISDKMTKLLWMKCDLDVPWDDVGKKCQPPTDVLGGGTGRTTYTWQEALIAANNTNINGFAGYNVTWRLPNVKELASILELNCLSNNPNEVNGTYAIDTTVFSTEVSTYWSSTPHPEAFDAENGSPFINQAWNVNFRRNTSDIGAVFSDINQTFHVRLVADDPNP